MPTGRRSGLAVVLDPGVSGLNEPRPLVLTDQRWAGRLSPADFTGDVRPLGRVKVPKSFDHRSPQARKDLSSTLRNAGVEVPVSRRRRAAGGDDDELLELRESMRRHPCHGCSDREDHARWAERYHRLSRETETLRRRVSNRTNTLARTFDRVCELLESRGYLLPHESETAIDSPSTELAGTADEVTAIGRRLSRIWSESDLLVAECLRQGTWDSLNPAELAAAVAAIVYEARGPGEEPGAVPRGPLADALAATARVWAEVEADESERGLSLTRQPEHGFVWPVYRWARGESLERVLRSTSGSGPDGELPAGDFVRWCRQVVDLLDQLTGAAAAGSPLAATAREAVGAVRRGVVAWSSLG